MVMMVLTQEDGSMEVLCLEWLIQVAEGLIQIQLRFQELPELILTNLGIIVRTIIIG